MDFQTGKQSGLICMIDEQVLDSFLDEVYGQQVLEEPCDGLKGGLYAAQRYGPRRCDPDSAADRCTGRGCGAGAGDAGRQLYHLPLSQPPKSARRFRRAWNSRTGAADLLLATDPDCDRCGTRRASWEWLQLMTGNEVGVLLLGFHRGGAGRRTVHCRKTRSGYNDCPVRIWWTPSPHAMGWSTSACSPASNILATRLAAGERAWKPFYPWL